MLHYYLEDLQVNSRELIKTLKGDGLIRGVEIVNSQGTYDPDKTKEIQRDLLENGVLVRHSKYVLIFKPPITITEKQMEKGFEIVKRVIKKYL